MCKPRNLRCSAPHAENAKQKRNHAETLAPIGQTPITPQSMLIFPLLFRRDFLFDAFEFLGCLNLRVHRRHYPPTSVALQSLNILHVLAMLHHLLAYFLESFDKFLVHKSKRVAMTPNSRLVSSANSFFFPSAAINDLH